MFGVKQDLAYSIWLTPHEIETLGTEPVKGKLQLDRHTLIDVRLALLPPDQLAPDAEVEVTEAVIHVSMTGDYHETLIQEGTVTLLTDNMELVTLYDVSRGRGPTGLGDH